MSKKILNIIKMRRFPRPSHTEPLTDGCLSTGILLALTALCPPIAIIFLIIYALYKDHEETANNFLAILIVGFILIGSPLVTFLSFISFGITETLHDSWFLVLITITEIIGIFIYLLRKYKISNEMPEERQERQKIEQEKAKENFERLKQQSQQELNDLKTDIIPSKDTKSIENKSIVFITPHGKKYHCDKCQCIKGRTDLFEITISKAEDKGCTPCGVCCKNKK